MKKVFLFIMLVTCAGHIMAQTLNQPLLGNKKYWSPYLKPKTGDNLFKIAPVLPKLNQPLLNDLEITKTIPAIADATQMKYNMPIAKVSSNDRMPIVQTDEPGMHYDMLIKRIGTVKPDMMIEPRP
ncbi:hypothetical protein [Mucilaginibacter sp.]|uniref:hypothetical protein n=1 Tax=Mucilaginibacter sp. TaxID=1882438 RepID=UPI0025F9E870|nr:hypothetical protein [Mucilaginibacter sp.]